jgi:hypothetical protein
VQQAPLLVERYQLLLVLVSEQMLAARYQLVLEVEVQQPARA